jgi:hypothetical protein
LNLSQVAGELEQVGDKQRPGIRVFGAINIFLENKMVVLKVRFLFNKINYFISNYFSGNQVLLMMFMQMQLLQLFLKQNQATVREISVNKDLNLIK